MDYKCTTQCPKCCERWTGKHSEVIHYGGICPNCARREAEGLDWIQEAPNPRLWLVLEAWLKCLGGVSLQSAINYVKSARPNAGFEKLSLDFSGKVEKLRE